MIYSCFNEQTGLYEYLEDNATQRMNGDLPIPSMPTMAGEIGVPAREAGRPAPMGAEVVGQGLEPRGIIVSCDNQTYRSLGDVYADPVVKVIAAVALMAAGAALVLLWPKGR
jgi:hypothetical protein